MGVEVKLQILQKFAAHTLFPSKLKITEDEPEDLFGEATLDNGDELPVENILSVERTVMVYNIC